MYNQMRAILYIAFSLNFEKNIFCSLLLKDNMSCFKLKSLYCDVF